MDAPKETVEIVEGVHWVGVKDWDRRMFDRLIPLPRGTSYNSYLVIGDEKTALVDSTNPGFSADLEEKIEKHVNLEDLADKTERFTGADLENLVRRAGLHALRENIRADRIPMAFFEKALKETRPSVTPQMEDEYRKIGDMLKNESPGYNSRMGFAVSSEQ